MTSRTFGTPPTRREFLARSSAVVAGLALTPYQRLFAVPLRSRQPIDSFAPPVLDAEALRQLARTAIDAAVHAGAEFADVRVSDRREYFPQFNGRLAFEFGCGVRVRVAGREAFAGSADSTPDGITRAAQSAVSMARALAAVSTPGLPLAPAPVVTGEWTAPIDIDPFTVAPDDHMFVGSGYTTLGRRHGADVTGGFFWRNETRVFASSEGSLITQHWTRCMPYFSAEFRHWRLYGIPTWLHIPAFMPCTGGFETVLGAERHDQFEAAVDEMAELAKYPVGLAEVGRKDVVLDGNALGALLGGTLIPSLSLGRVLGEEQNAGGTSFLSPPETVLGQTLFSPQLTLRVAQGMPYDGAMRWDDEGVATTPLTLVDRGAVVNYLGTRATLPVLATLPGRSKGATASPGTAFSPEVWTLPSSSPATFVAQANASGPSLAELVKTVKNGFVMRDAWIEGDQQGAGGALHPYMMFEVQNGKITRRVIQARIEFATKKMLHSIDGVGNARSVAPGYGYAGGGLPFSTYSYTVCAPAVLLKELNIVSNHVSVA